jgi:hypothetical protein
MTVAQLIAELQKLDPQARVVIVDSSQNPPMEFPVLCCTEYNPGEITLEY